MCSAPSYALASLTDGELLAGLERVVARSNQVTADLLAHIGEVDARRLYLPAGCNSMFTYCVRVLGLSEDATYKRIQAARAARRYPLIFDLVASGRLHLAAVTLLAPYLAPSNHRDLLNAAVCLTKRDVERLVAHRFPSQTAPSFVRRCPCGLPPTDPLAAPTTESGTSAAITPEVCAGSRTGDAQPAPGQVGPDESECHGGSALPQADPSVAPAPGPASFKIQFTAGEQLCDKLRAAQELLGHSVPRGDLAQVFERALDALLSDLRRRKFGYTDRPVGDDRREGPAGPRTRAIPAAVRREVAARDGEQCTFVDPSSGRRCDAKTDLQFHHLEPYAQGGGHHPTTLTLRCSAHNLHAARQDYGAEFIAGKIAGAGARPPPVAAGPASSPGSRSQRTPPGGEADDAVPQAPPRRPPPLADGSAEPSCTGPQIP
jgi:hypothetical protein